MEKRNCIIGQSGGPTVAINSSLAGIIDGATASCQFDHIYGMLNGIEGLLNYEISNLSHPFSEFNKIEQLKRTPAMYLGSCRFKLNPEDTPLLDKIFKILDHLKITDFFYIGGNDSMDTILTLSDYAKSIQSDIHFVGVPKTIDNDLMGTDHTPGFGSAAKYIATVMLEVIYDSMIYNKQSVTIVEIMGRNAGWLTAAAALAKTDSIPGVDLIYLPELPFSTEKLIQSIQELFQSGKQQIVIAVSEGIKNQAGDYISNGDISASLDAFGHISRSGVGRVLESLVSDFFGCKVRSIEINVLQRSSMHCASKTDLTEAFTIGRSAVNAALQNETGIVMTYKRKPGSSYSVEIQWVDVHKVANLEKLVPREWINAAGNHVNGTMINYLLPLIQGEVLLDYKNGIPNYL
ncbi:MAG: 6-phosphofructokinase [Acetivibrio sp.]